MTKKKWNISNNIQIWNLEYCGYCHGVITAAPQLQGAFGPGTICDLGRVRYFSNQKPSSVKQACNIKEKFVSLVNHALIASTHVNDNTDRAGLLFIAQTLTVWCL